MRAVGRALAVAARDDLMHVDDDPVAAVHDARREIRSARAVLRLVRISLGEKEYRRQSEALRRAAGHLSSHRDAHVLESAFNRLIGHCPTLDDEHATSFRRVLLTDRQRTEHPLTLAAASALIEIDVFDAGIERWPRKGRVIEIDVATGFERTLRRARRAAEDAAADPTADALHNLRKRAKDTREQLRTLMPLVPERFGRLERRYTRLCARLGEGCDQVVLAGACEHLSGRHPGLEPTIGRVRRAALGRFESVAQEALVEALATTGRSPHKIAGRLLDR